LKPKLDQIQDIRRALVAIHTRLSDMDAAEHDEDPQPTLEKSMKAIRRAVGKLSEYRLELGYRGD